VRGSGLVLHWTRGHPTGIGGYPSPGEALTTRRRIRGKLGRPGIATAFFLGTEGYLIWVLTAMIAAATLYFVVFWFRQPVQLAAGMRRRLNPATLCRVDADGVAFMAGDRSATIVWSRVKATLERPSYYLCVLSPMSFFVVPTTTLPAQAEALLRERV
jgi:hypothetical protein